MSIFLGWVRVLLIMLVVVSAARSLPAAETREESSITVLTEFANDLHERAEKLQQPTQFTHGSSWVVILGLVVIACLPQAIMRA